MSAAHSHRPALVVAVADEDVRYCGDGEWFGECPEPGCRWYTPGFSKGEAQRLLAGHIATEHTAHRVAG